MSSGNLLEVGVLLLLSDHPDHGYSILHRLIDLGIDFTDDPGTLYRRLRVLEERGLVDHRMQRSNKGPARKVYSIGPSGHEALDARIPDLYCVIQTTRRCLDLYSQTKGAATPGVTA
ncbi:PadR family transcriptional regulator [Nocardia sp. NPDC058640]|uniref:PadR family transcriptional regulator n=1 Tax=Nocardia sp. NPDC058640 TaxID=3346571 RepID=UPI00365F60CB